MGELDDDGLLLLLLYLRVICAGEMRSHAVQADESDGHELCGRCRSGFRQRAAMVQEILGRHPAVGVVAAVHHVFWHVQRIHGHHRHQLPAAVRASHGRRGRHRGCPVLHCRVARTARAAQLCAQPQVPGARLLDCQSAHGRRSGHHVLLSALRHAQRHGQAAGGLTGHVSDVLLPHRVRHGGHRSGT